MPKKHYDKKSGILVMAPEIYQHMNHPRIRRGPFCDDKHNKEGMIYEHILIAEQMLGRPLESKEVVFHIDGNKLNNTHENLKVFKNKGTMMAWIKKRKEEDLNVK